MILITVVCIVFYISICWGSEVGILVGLSYIWFDLFVGSVVKEAKGTEKGERDAAE